MVVTASLKHTDIEQLLPVFNEAFSDYDVPVSKTLAALQAHLQSLSYTNEDSVGLFEKRDLVGFLLIGRRGNTAYDAGTGIIPSYRGKGLSHILIDDTIGHLRSRGCTTFVLEVLDTNTKAKNLYLSHGFAIKRSLLCFSVKQEEITGRSDLILENHDKGYIVPASFEPSYQNSDESVAEGAYTCSDIVEKGVRKGFVWYHPNRGSIAQINIEPGYRDVDLLKQAIISCTMACTAQSVRMLNVDHGDNLTIKALQEVGFSNFTTQSEMTLTLSESQI